MKNKNKILMITVGCIGIGIVLLVIGLALGGRPGFYINSTGVHTGFYTSDEKSGGTAHTQKKVKLDEFTGMDINVRYADLEILPSDGYYIEYRLDGSDPAPTLEIENKTLHFKEGSSHSFFGFNFFVFNGFHQISEHYYIKLYVPEDQYFSTIRIQTDDGTVKIGDIRAKAMEIKDDYGQVEIESFQGELLKVGMNDGALKIENLNAREIDIDNAYGKCQFGSVKGQNMEANLDDGNFTVGQCEIINLKVDNHYGSVNIGLTKKIKDYDFDLKTDYGDIEIPGFPEISSGGSDERIYRSDNGAESKIQVRCDDGDIIISVAE